MDDKERESKPRFKSSHRKLSDYSNSSFPNDKKGKRGKKGKKSKMEKRRIRAAFERSNDEISLRD